MLFQYRLEIGVRAMQKFNNIVCLSLISIFLASCSTGFKVVDRATEGLVGSDRNLIDKEPNVILETKPNRLVDGKEFVSNQVQQIQKDVALGPVLSISAEKAEEIKKNERREINKEEKNSYIAVSDDAEPLFPVSFNFENVNIRDVARMFAEITGNNILMGDEVEGLVSAKLINVPWDKALDSVLTIKTLAKHIDKKAKIIRIHKQDVINAQESFERQRIADLQKTREAERSVKDIYTEIFRLYYINAATVKAEIESVLSGGGSDGDSGGDSQGGGSSGGNVRITVDERLNSIIVQATKSEIELIARLIKEVDVPTQQVLIEAFIVEAEESFTLQLGNKFGMIAGNIGSVGGYDIGAGGIAGTASDSSKPLVMGDGSGDVSATSWANPLAGIGFLLNSTSSSLKFELRAAELRGITKVISNPRVFALDKEEANIIQGEEIPYKDDEGAISFKEAGVKLSVTPTIVGDGSIVLDVKIEKKTANSSLPNPPINTREIKTKLLVKDGTIAVIGGVFSHETSDSNNKVPFASKLPFVGKFFRHEKDTDTRKELLVFLAPRII